MDAGSAGSGLRGSRAREAVSALTPRLRQVLEAEGRKEAAFRDAEARERLAEAEARATQVVSEAISKGDVQALNYFVAQKYTDALTRIGSANNHKVVLMPIEASSLIGSLGGIGAIAREVFGNGGGSPVTPRPTTTARSTPNVTTASSSTPVNPFVIRPENQGDPS